MTIKGIKLKWENFISLSCGDLELLKKVIKGGGKGLESSLVPIGLKLELKLSGGILNHFFKVDMVKGRK